MEEETYGMGEDIIRQVHLGQAARDFRVSAAHAVISWEPKRWRVVSRYGHACPTWADRSTRCRVRTATSSTLSSRER